MKRFVSLSLALLLILSVFATTGIADTAKQKVVVWTWYSEQLGPSVGAAFMEKFPQYELEMVTIPSGELEQKLLAAIAAGSGLPDATSIQGESIQKFIAYGGLLDLTDRIAPLVDSYPPYKIANDSDADGRIYGVPIDCGPCALYYQKDLAEECGIDPEVDFATWDSWIASGEKYKAKGYALHRMTELGDAGALSMWTQQQGQSFFDADGNATLNTPEFLNSVKLLKALWDSGTTGDWAEWSPQYSDAIVGKQVGTLYGAAWYMNTFIHSFADAENWGIVPLPAFEGSDVRTANRGGSEMMIPEDAENPDGGWEFIKFYVGSTDSVDDRLNALGEFPAYMPLFDLPEVQDKTLKFFGDQKVFTFFSELLDSVPSFRTPGAFSAVRDNMIEPELPKLMSGEMTPEDFVAHCQSLAEGIVRDF